ncbi:MAG: hypothetical protein KDB22_08830 [Planctomycetales bacterium]|nr:hypothetical protein [Planctomycetales bacterium]
MAKAQPNKKLRPDNRRTKSPSAKDERKKQSKSWRLLAICLFILVIGLAIRYYLHTQQLAMVSQLKTATEAAWQSGEWGQAEELATQWAVRQPREYEPWHYAAEAAMALGDFRRAAEYLSQVPSDAPVSALHDLSAIQMEELNRPQEAIATCLRALEVYPSDSELHERLLFFYSMTCQRDSLIAEARRAIGAGADTLATYAYLMGARWLTFQNGFEINRRWLESAPDSELFAVASVVHLVAKRDIKALNLPEVDSELAAMPKKFYQEQIIALRAKYPRNLELLAAELAFLREADDTEQVAQLLAAAPPESVNDNRFWRYKGWLHATVQEWQAAKSAYEKSLELSPFDWATEFELVAVLRASENIAASLEMQARSSLGQKITRAIQLAPTIRSLTPPSIYDDMEEYFRMCQQPGLADSLHRALGK